MQLIWNVYQICIDSLEVPQVYPVGFMNKTKDSKDLITEPGLRGLVQRIRMRELLNLTAIS